MRELVGDDGHEIAEYMFSVLSDETQRTADRMEAAKWLADRGFGRTVQALDVGVNQVTMEDLFRGFSGEDLEALLAIYERNDVVDIGRVRRGLSRHARFAGLPPAVTKKLVRGWSGTVLGFARVQVPMLLTARGASP